MKIISKLILPLIAVAVIAVIYYIYFAPTKELGSFSKYSPGSEINQEINVAIVKSKGFERIRERNPLQIRRNPSQKLWRIVGCLG